LKDEQRKKIFSISNEFARVDQILDSLPRGTASRFICEAILEKHERETNPNSIENQVKALLTNVVQTGQLHQVLGGQYSPATTLSTFEAPPQTTPQFQTQEEVAPTAEIQEETPAPSSVITENEVIHEEQVIQDEITIKVDGKETSYEIETKEADSNNQEEVENPTTPTLEKPKSTVTNKKSKRFVQMLVDNSLGGTE